MLTYCSHTWHVQGDSARSGAEIITLGAVNTNPNVDAIPGPAVSRTYATVVVLPTGEVAHFGGAQEAVEFSEVTVVLSTGDFLSTFLPSIRFWGLERLITSR